MAMGKWVKTFGEMGKKDTEEAGGKAANLSELTRHGFPVPEGFCVTSPSLQHLVDANDLQSKIDEIAASFDFGDYEGMETKTQAIRDMIGSARIPEDLLAEIEENVAAIIAHGSIVAVRSSVSVKDSPLTSFPGMTDTYHYLRSEEGIVEHIKKCWASLWNTRATFDRRHKEVDQSRGLMAVIVQRMVCSEVAGILSTANPMSGSRDELVIEANFGLGESVSSGKSMTDFYLVDRSTLEEKRRRIARKTVICVFDEITGWGRRDTELPPEKAGLPTLSAAEVRHICATGLKIEELFGAPQDIEWAKANGSLYILQARAIRNLKEVQRPAGLA